MQDCYFDRSTADLSMMKEGRRKKMKAGNVASDVRSTTTMNAQKTQKPPFLSPLFFYLSLTLYPLSISPQYIFCSFLLYIRRFSIIAFQINRRPRQSIDDYRLIAHLGYCNFLTTFSPNCVIQFIRLNNVLLLGKITKYFSKSIVSN